MERSTGTSSRSSFLRGLRGHLARPIFVALVLAILLTLNPYGIRGQEAYNGSIDQVVVAEDAEHATAFVTVVDGTGQPVPDAAGFSASVDGASVEIESVESVVNEDSGVAALLVIDNSNSMAGEPLAQARSAGVAFVQGLLPPDVASVLTFGPTVGEPTPFTNDRDAAVDTLEAIRIAGTGGTALYDAVVRGLDVAKNAPTPRRAVLLLTDGQDSGGVSSQTREDAVAAAAAAGIPIYSVALGPDADTALLEQVSDEAGGAFFSASGPSDVPAIFDAIGNALRGQHALHFKLPESTAPQRNLTVSFEVDGVRYGTSATFNSAPTLVPSSDGGGGLSPLLVGFIVVLALLVIAGAVFLLRRRRRFALPAGVAAGRGEDAEPVPTAELVEISSKGSGKLTVIAGPNTGVTAALAGHPLDVGSDASCGLCLDASNGAVAGTHARVWLQHGRLMLHHLARKQQTLVGQKPVEWAALEPNETMQIGPHVIGFSIED